mmetsp:Transcript_15743/g.18960  ORF Transcript_15743/g.18960 Transcript_15743/m.18960 type:complete len:361 (-) Transcript_15743:495-1577(-)
MACKAHSQGMSQECIGIDVPHWCSQSWCFVDPDKCQLCPEKPGYCSKSSLADGLFYSYEVCGEGYIFGDSDARSAEIKESVKSKFSEPMKLFMAWHSWIMFGLIPPVVSGVVVNYLLLASFCVIHVMEFSLLDEKIQRRLRKRFARVREMETNAAAMLKKGDLTHQQLEEVIRNQEMANEEFKNLLNGMVELCEDTQGRISKSCGYWSTINTHFLLFAMIQLLVVHGNAYLHLSGGALNELGYSYFWILSDIFHCVSAMFVIIVNFKSGAAVTAKANEAIDNVMQFAQHEMAMGHPRLSVLEERLKNYITGFDVYGASNETQQIIVMTMLAEVVLNIIKVIIWIVQAQHNYLTGNGLQEF